MRNFLSMLGLLFLLACPKKSEQPPDRPDVPPPPPPPAATDRVPAVAQDHPLHARVEGTSFENDCTEDSQCVKGGCSAEVCSAEEVTTTCEFPEGGFPKGDDCGCVSGQCIWYTSTATGSAR